MTLHWWMHWFWITHFTLSVCFCNPLPSNMSDEIDTSTTIGMPSFHYYSRVGKAIGYSSKTPVPTEFSTPIPYQKVSIIFPYPTSSDLNDDGSSLQHEISQIIDAKKGVSVENQNVTLITPETSNKTINESRDTNVTESNVNVTEIDANVTVAPIVPDLVVKPVVKSSNNSLNSTVKADNVTKEVPVKNDSVSVVNEAEDVELSTVRALSLETAVGRRAVDTPEIRESNHVTPSSGLDAAGVTGICFGVLVVLALGGAISFVLYRRRYLNKPQTLNDKCSNPDSSGYIDDSTIRENSEEMYSLDNDSFLNSLEAMTIQNYWTDSVKHTKL